jgi:hypothetical protein
MKISKTKKTDTDEIHLKYGNYNQSSVRGNVVSIGSQEAVSSVRRLAIRKEHEEAVRTFAVECYLLDEMPEDEQLCFEQHCVECPTCADAVEAGRIFIANVAPLSQPESSSSWFSRTFKTVARGPWLKPAAAMAAVCLPVVGWQQFRIVDLGGAHANTVIVARAAEKSAEDKTVLPLKTDSATIEFYVPPAPSYSFYRAKIAGGQGRSLSQVLPAPAKDSGQRLSVQVLRQTLGSGHFTVQVEGLAGEDSRDGQRLDDVYEFDLK